MSTNDAGRARIQQAIGIFILNIRFSASIHPTAILDVPMTLRKCGVFRRFHFLTRLALPAHRHFFVNWQ
jgi:hypothetical protein